MPDSSTIENKQAVGGTQPAPPEYAPGERKLDSDVPEARTISSKNTDIRNPAPSLKKR